MGSISNDSLVQSFEAEDAVAKKGLALIYGTGAKKVKLGTDDGVLCGLAYATSKDPITGVAKTGVQIGVVPLIPGLEVDLPLVSDNQVIAYGNPLCVSGNDTGEFDQKDGTNEDGTLVAYALEAVPVNTGGYVKARISK